MPNKIIGKNRRTKRREKKNGAPSTPRIRCHDDAIMNRLQGMEERELTFEVLVPLFRAIGYQKVEYVGGHDEEGKDLICSRKDEVDEEQLAVVQVKRYRFTARAADRNSFSEVVSQLSQAIEKPVLDLAGNRVLPAKVYFVTPYAVEMRALQTRLEAYQSLRARNAKIIDGPKLVALLKNHLPLLARHLAGFQFDVTDHMREQLNNDPLMSALGSTLHRDIGDFYTDIDFSLGRRTTRLFLTADFSPKTIPLELSSNEWESLRQVARRCLKSFGIDVLSKSEGEIESAYASEQRSLASWLKKGGRPSAEKERLLQQFAAIEETLSRMRDRVREADQGLEPQRSDARRDLFKAEKSAYRLMIRVSEMERSQHPPDDLWDAQKARRAANEQVRKLKRRLEQLTTYSLKDFDNLTTELNIFRQRIILDRSEAAEAKRALVEYIRANSTTLCNMQEPLGDKKLIGDRTLLQELEHFQRVVLKLGRVQSTLDKLPKQPSEPRYRVLVDGTKLANFLAERRAWVCEQVSQINTAVPQQEALRSFLCKCADVFSESNEVLKCAQVCMALGIHDARTTLTQSPYRLGMSIHRVFDAGISVLLLGEAGAGKTTSLKMYWKNKVDAGGDDEVCLFVPLAQLVNAWEEQSRRRAPATSRPLLEDAVVAYLSTVQIHVSKERLIDVLEKRRTILLLDGIDEAIKKAPWLLDAIKGAAGRYDGLQTIVSSRSAGQYLEDLPFFSVTLLPFTDAQQNRFFDLWFKGRNPEHRRIIRRHLRGNREIVEVVRNPLLATVLCILAEHEVSLPRTEPRLYEDRMKLLTGHYDVHKHIGWRLDSRSEDLLFLARKIAFRLHERGDREEDIEVIYRIAIDEARDTISSERCVRAVDEMVDPCNILVPMGEQGKMGFGHLRYQEYLAADEILRNRSIDVRPLLGNRWWRDTFVLLARMSADVSWLVDLVVVERVTKRCKETIREMLKVRPARERRELDLMLWRGLREDKTQDAIESVEEWADEQEDIEGESDF